MLVRTSNPGAADLQDLELAAGGTVSDRLARIVAELGTGGIGAAGLSDIGAVVGATAPERMEALRELMPRGGVPAARRGRAGRTGRAAVSRIRPGPGGRAGRGLAGNRRRLPKERGRSRGSRRRRGGQTARARVERWRPEPLDGARTSEFGAIRMYDRAAMVRRSRGRYLAPIALAAAITGTYLVVHNGLTHKSSTTPSHVSSRPKTTRHGKFATSEVLRRQARRHAVEHLPRRPASPSRPSSHLNHS